MVQIHLTTYTHHKRIRNVALNKKYRIATWNVERPRRINARRQLISQKIENVNSDIIILTETSNLIDLGTEYFAVKTQPAVTCPNEQWATIWTKWPVIRELPTYDDTRAICALIRTPFGDLIVYGTILPYHMAGVNAGGKYLEQDCSPWELHEKSIVGLGDDLKKLKLDYPDSPLCIAGDFNQTRDNLRGGYGNNRLKLLLGEILHKNHLNCLTEENFSENGKLNPDPKTGKTRRNIDHICISSAWKSLMQNLGVNAWDHFNELGFRMSDHNGVLFDFEISEFKKV